MKKPPARVAAPSTLGSKLEELALALAVELKSTETPMDEKIGGFKALTAYYAMINKLPPPPDDTKGGFSGWSDKLKADSRRGRSRAGGHAGNGSTPDF